MGTGAVRRAPGPFVEGRALARVLRAADQDAAFLTSSAIFSSTARLQLTIA